MNWTLYTSVESDAYEACPYNADQTGIWTDTISMEEDPYATVPMMASQPIFQQPDEEEMYTSFEKALSDRVLSTDQQLCRMSSSHAKVCLQVQAQAVPTNINGRAQFIASRDVWQQGIVLISFALLLVLLGFGLIGLLIWQAAH